MSGRQFNPDHSAATSFDNVAAYDVVLAPVGALDENIGLNSVHDRVWGVLIKNHRSINARQRKQHLGALALRIDRTIAALVRPDRAVGIHADDQRVAQRARILKVTDVAWMQQVEHAICKDDLASARPNLGGESRRLVGG